MRLFEILIFCLILGFLDTYPLIIFSILSDFFETGVFWYYATFLNFVFNPPRFLLETEGFVSIEDSLGFSALCGLHQKFV